MCKMTFFVMNLACFLLKIGSAPNFRPAFKFFSWQTAFLGSIMSAAAMFFIEETYAATAVCVLVLLFILLHYLSPPKHWGDVSQNLIYHQVRKYLLRLKPEHIKFWRPQIILLINNPRRQTRLIQFCNSMKKGALYILGHVIVTADFKTGVHEAKLQQSAWANYITEYSRIKAFVQLTMSPTITWGVRNLILSAGLGGMRPNIAIIGFYNMEELRASQPWTKIPETPLSPKSPRLNASQPKSTGSRRRRGDSAARLMEGALPTDAIRTEERISSTEYMTMLEDLALRYRLNVAVGKGFEVLETPRRDGSNSKKYVDLWPIQMSAEIEADGKSVLTTNFDTYTLILQLGYILHTVEAWHRAFRLRVMVFVEYETEVEEERGRLEALLEKLRIQADVNVFWLACGDLESYEAIIHGRSGAATTEILVDEVLKNEPWWGEVQRKRGKGVSMSGSQELASMVNIIDSTSGRPGTYNPHDEIWNRRRPSLALQGELPKNPTVSSLARLGVSMGIHTQNLPRKVFRLGSDSGEESSSEGDSDAEISMLDADFNDDQSAVGEDDVGESIPVRRPIVSDRRRSHEDAILKRPVPQQKRTEDDSSRLLDPSSSQTYGTMTQDAHAGSRALTLRPVTAPQHSRNVHHSGSVSAGPVSPIRDSMKEAVSDPQSVQQSSTNLSRPGILRTVSSSMRFTSTVVPETTIIEAEGSTGPTIMFAKSNTPSSARPGFSRTNSANRFASRLSSELPFQDEAASSFRVAFVETEATSSQQPAPTEEPDDTHLNIPELVDDYRNRSHNESESGSSYATQDLPLSFNDLPSRAQHLILNELMRQESLDTAVLLTTLPIPEEGTCESEDASIQYLSDVEVLCHELPPTLLVLSNNMTVTVSL
jgi:solute carrier family 12 (potassium/chloride transporters), member 9